MKTLILTFDRPAEQSIPSTVSQRTIQFLAGALPAVVSHTYGTGAELLRVLKEHQATVAIVGPALPRSVGVLLKGMEVVLISIGTSQECGDLVDISIDPLQSVRAPGFTGPAYLLPELLKEIDGQAVAKSAKLSVEELQHEVARNKAKEELVSIVSLFCKLQWDSDFFGFNVGYIACLRLTPNIQKQVRDFVKKENITLLEYQCDCHDRTSILVAEKEGYSFVDIRFTLSRKLQDTITCHPKDGVTFRRAVETDIPSLRAIAHNAYQDSRYYFDGNFDQEKLVEFYEEWAEKAVRGTFEDYAYVLEIDGKVCGFCSVKIEGSRRARLGLVGIGAAFAGQGLGTQLITCVLADLRGQGIDFVHVTTQGRNYAAQRLYQKCGFLTEKTGLWYHKWMR